MSIETQEQALAEATSRFGLDAFAVQYECQVEIGTVQFPIMDGMRITVYGVGETWDEAFADADNRSRKQGV